MTRQRKPLSYALRFAVLASSRFRCHYCGQPAPGVVLHVEHVIPLSAGGTDDPTNLVAACSACNGGKAGAALEAIGRCPGERHPGPFFAVQYGPMDAPLQDIVLVCETCRHIVSWYTPPIYPTLLVPAP